VGTIQPTKNKADLAILLPDHSDVSCYRHDISFSSTMNPSGINITEVVEQTKAHLQNDADATPELKASIELILMVVVLLAQRLGLFSQNSSIPPSKDGNRKKLSSKPSDKKAGGQIGPKDLPLVLVDEPDEVQNFLRDA
jgi:transposase